MSRIITLDNGIEYMQLAKPVLNGETFLFVASVTDKPDYVFLREVDKMQVEILEDENLILQLLELVRVDVLEKLKKFQDEAKSGENPKK